MKQIKSFLIIGGDSRQIYIADYLESLGFDVKVYGLNDKSRKNETDVKHAIKNSDAIILPLPVTKDGKKIFSLVDIKESLDEVISYLDSGQAVFAGLINKGTENKLRKKDVLVFDYFRREEVTVMNTVPTAQGIIKEIIDNIDYTIYSSKCAVFGYGRVGKYIAYVLKSLGAEVSVCARKFGDIALAQTKGCTGILISDFEEYADKFDIIINTVPSLVLDKKALQNLQKNCFIIDIASAPFGTDFSAAYELGINAKQCSSLPGKVAPKTAGKIIADGILNIIKEEAYE